MRRYPFGWTALIAFCALVSAITSGVLEPPVPTQVQDVVDRACDNSRRDPSVGACSTSLVERRAVGHDLIYLFLGDLAWRDGSHSYVPLAVRVDETGAIKEQR